MTHLGMRLFSFLVLITLFFVGVAVQESASNFVQCSGGPCGGGAGTTTGPDIVNGTDRRDNIGARAGDDVIFGRAGNDLLGGGPGDDFISTGSGNDEVFGAEGRDTILVGGDDGTRFGFQDIFGGDDNDLIIVLPGLTFGIGEGCPCPGTVIGCAGGDQDVVMFFYGPYIYHQPDPPMPFDVFDPISGGQFSVVGTCETVVGLAALPDVNNTP